MRKEPGTKSQRRRKRSMRSIIIIIHSTLLSSSLPVQIQVPLGCAIVHLPMDGVPFVRV